MSLLGHYDIEKLPLSLVTSLATAMKDSFNHNFSNSIGIDYDCWRVLALIAEEPSSNNSLQERLNFTRTQINQCMQLIQKNEWVNSEKKGRQLTHSLSDNGQLILSEVSKFARIWERRCYQNIDANEIHQFNSIINALRQNVADIDIKEEA